MRRRPTLRFETLEARDVPATFFASPLSAAITDAGGAVVSLDAGAEAAADAANVDAAVFLGTGDKLVFDANFNGKKDAGDTVLASVTAGEAFAFFEDDNNDGVFTPVDFLGVAVSDGFVGSLRGTDLDVLAAVVAGTLTESNNDLVVPVASIDGLTVVGSIGNVGAGGDISNVKVTAVKGIGGGAIFAGTAVSSQSFFDNGSADFLAADGTDGASIRNVSASHGIRLMLAGSGGVDGVGGSITDVVFGASPAGTLIKAGDAGDSALSAGPAGGGISNVSITAPVMSGSVELTAGAGAAGGTVGGNVSGGAGGGVTGVTLSVGQTLGGVRLIGGNGGNGRNGGPGGEGGAVSAVRGTIGYAAGGLSVQAGRGGDGGPSGAGGTGGAIRDARLKVTGTLGEQAFLLAGQGGLGSAAAPSGDGGGLADIAVTVNDGTGEQGVQALGGAGGPAAIDGQAGNGGDVDRVRAKVTGRLLGAVQVAGGPGGNANEAGDDGAGGDGGGVDRVSLSVAIALGGGFFHLQGGAGGHTEARGDGGDGGSLANATVTLAGGLSQGISGSSGTGGSAEQGTGGDAGNIADVRTAVKAAATANAVFLFAGSGGGSDTAAAGTGGSLERILVANAGILDEIVLLSGSGGGGGGGGAAGGGILDSNIRSTGSVDDITVQTGPGGTDTDDGVAGTGGEIARLRIQNNGVATAGSEVFILTGDGGSAGGPTAVAGNGGAITDLTYQDARGDTEVFIGTGDGGDRGAAGFGGAIDGLAIAAPRATVTSQSGNGGTNGIVPGDGGAVRGVRGSAGFLTLESGNGGSTNLFGFSGGDGGAIEDVDVAVTFFAQRIMTGTGGNAGGAAGTTGGSGGRIADVAIRGRGDIGNFNVPFEANQDGMGGLIVGRAGSGGTNGAAGSVDGVQARRIAAIFAGDDGTRGDELTDRNAANSVANVTANVIGADVDGDGEFDFENTTGDGFDPDEADVALDGFVFVVAGGFDADSVNVDPLLVIEA